MEPRIDWPRNDYSRVPFRLHHDEEIYRLEMERIFRGPAWSFLCLEAEIPNPGDYRTTWVGDTPVIVSRDKEGAIHAFVNRCSPGVPLSPLVLLERRRAHGAAVPQRAEGRRRHAAGLRHESGVAAEAES